MLESLNLSRNEVLGLPELIMAVRGPYPLARIKLFGSKATGTFDVESDVDVLVLLPSPVSDAVRKQIVHKVFEINLDYESNISVLILSEEEWDSSMFSFLPIHTFVEKEGASL